MTPSRPFLDDIHPLDPEYWSSALDGEISPQEMERLLKYPPKDLRQVRDAWQHHQLIGHYLRHGSCCSISLTKRVMMQICPEEAQEVPAVPVTRPVKPKRWSWPLHGVRLVTAGLAAAAITTWVSSTFFLSTAPEATPSTVTVAGVASQGAPVTSREAAAPSVPIVPMGPAMTVNAAPTASTAHTVLPQDPVFFASGDNPHYKTLNEPKLVADSNLDELRLLHWSQATSMPQAQLIAEMHEEQ